MKAFHLIAGAAVLSLFLQCGNAEKNTVKKTSAAVPSVKAASPAETAKPAAGAAPAADPRQAQDTLVVIARLIEIPGTFPSNDLYNYIYIMKYRVMSVVKGAYKGQEILVGHYNPRIPRARIKDRMAPYAAGDVVKFETGDKHRLELITPLKLDIEDRVEDEYVDSDLDKYYALKADVAQ